HRILLMVPAHVIQKDKLSRIGVIGAAVRQDERVLAGTENGQGLAVGTELRTDSFARDEIGICGKPGVQKLLRRSMRSGRRDVMTRRGLQALRVLVLVGLRMHRDRYRQSHDAECNKTKVYSCFHRAGQTSKSNLTEPGNCDKELHELLLG